MRGTLTIQFFTTLVLLAFWLWTRRRDRREVSRLVAELTECRSTLLEFMQETEATFAVFSGMVRKAERPKAARPVPAAINLPDAAPPTAESCETSLHPAVDSQASSKKSQVLKLADQGFQSVEIASQLTIPQGEIELILNLNRRAARC